MSKLVKTYVRIPPELAEKLINNKSLWTERQIYDFANYGKMPPLSSVLTEYILKKVKEDAGLYR